MIDKILGPRQSIKQCSSDYCDLSTGSDDVIENKKTQRLVTLVENMNK